MATEENILNNIRKQKFIPLFYHNDSEVCAAIVTALYAGGCRMVEFTDRGTHSLANFEKLVKLRDKEMPDLLLAAGTIKTPASAQQFINGGADMLISPMFDNSVFDVAYLHKKIWVPGCATATEIHVAEKAGCGIVKLFPGSLLSPSFVEAVKAVFPNMNFIITGGVDVTEENLKAWFKSGALAVGIGSKLISQSIIDTKSFEELTSKTSNLISIINEINV